MHYAVLVIVPTSKDLLNGRRSLDRVVEAQLAAWYEEEWDWYQIGGRWTGVFDGYKPELDPANIEACDLCGGTGDRATFRGEPREDQHPSGCNGCLGKGKRAKWPTDWVRHDGDVKPVEQLTVEDLSKFYAVVVDGGWYPREKYDFVGLKDGTVFDESCVRRTELELPSLESLREHGGLAVVVDCHN